MKPIDHCKVCDNHSKDLNTGIICNLTKKKPEFTTVCPKGNFHIHLLRRIEEVAVEYEMANSALPFTVLNFIFFLFVSAGITTFGYLLSEFMVSRGWFPLFGYILMFFGVTMLKLATGPAGKYRTAIKIAKDKQKELKDVLKAYGIDWWVDVKLKKQNHGFIKISTDILLFKHGKKLREYSNSIDYNTREKERGQKQENPSDIIHPIDSIFNSPY